MSIAALREQYHMDLCQKVLGLRAGKPNLADKSSRISLAVAQSVVEQLPCKVHETTRTEQRVGAQFEQLTAVYLESAFRLLAHIRPGKWVFAVNQPIADFEQYEHLAELRRVLKEHPEMKAALGGDYVVTPDITVSRQPVSDAELNLKQPVVTPDGETCRFSPLRAGNHPGPKPILHASISCKWTIRSDRAQNMRTEGLNLIRNRKGHTPHILAVTAEPLPSRIASLALGTGDLDCVYHSFLIELRRAVASCAGNEQREQLESMIAGRRLRDISDLPLDLAV